MPGRRGGYGQSRYGKDLSLYALEDSTQVEHVMANLGWGARFGAGPDAGRLTPP